ncbi:MAG: hypothetical protein WCQ49_01565 [Candidatus Saccharibacteria bacterium]
MNEQNKRPESYIGVSGIVNPEQQKQLETMADIFGFVDLRRKLMLGVEATHKTQFNNEPNAWGSNWYPVGNELRSAIESKDVSNDPNSMRIVKLAVDPTHMADSEYRRTITQYIFNRSGKWVDGVQFSKLPWHTNPDMIGYLENIKSKYGTKILLKVQDNTMMELGANRLVDKLEDYAGIIDYLILDSNTNAGRRFIEKSNEPENNQPSFDADRLSHFLGSAYSSSKLGSVGIALAGGIDSKVVKEDLKKIISEYPDLSWDGEDKLHPIILQKNNSRRPLDMNLAEDYMKSSTNILKV